jgi:hypothetical protein
MRIPVSIYYIVLFTLFAAVPVLAAESISQIQSLRGQVWVQRGDEKIEVNTESEIYFGDLISTSDTGQLAIQLWSQVILKLDANSKITIIPTSNNSATNNKEEKAAALQKIIKFSHGTGCIEIRYLLDSPVLFQMGERVTVNFIKPVELCLSSNIDESHFQLIKGSVEIRQLTSSMLIALNQPGSAISFYDDGTFNLVSASSVAPQVDPSEDLKEPPITENPIESSETEDSKVSPKTDDPNESYTVYLNSSRSYQATAEVNRRLLDSGYSSVVIDLIDDKGPLFRVSVPNFETATAARTFVDMVAGTLGIHDAWIERNRR